MARKAETKDSPVSITDHHNLARPDNMDNQAALRYVAHRVGLVSRSDSTGWGAVKTWSAVQGGCDSLRRVFCRALRRPRLDMVKASKQTAEEEEGLWYRIRTKSRDIESFDLASVVDPGGQKSRSLANRIEVDGAIGF